MNYIKKLCTKPENGKKDWRMMSERLHVWSARILQNMHLFFLSQITSLKYCYQVFHSSSVMVTQRVIYLERYLDFSRKTGSLYKYLQRISSKVEVSATRIPCCVANYSSTAISCISCIFL